MPLYDFRCEAGHKFDRFLRLAEYDAPQVCDCGAPASKMLSAPMVMPDIQAYQSPIDGRTINSRKQRREDLARNGCVEYEPSMKEHAARARAQEEAKLDAAVDSTVESAIHAMPARKRERLISEMEAGADIDIVRT
jgi:putative FmdB family regulatory protein